jgi:hypothetical protein
VIRALFAIGSFVCFASALDPCQLGPSGDDGGSSSSSGSSSDSGSETIGAQCSAIVTEFCSQAINRCGLAGFTLSDCVTNDMGQCCTSGGSCDQSSNEPASTVDTCKTDIDNEDCNGVVNSTLPSSCQPLLRP